MHTVHLGSLSICRAQAARDKQGGSTAPHSVVKAINTKQPAAAVRNEVTELRAENARLMAALAAAEARAVPEGPVASLTGLGLEIAAKAGKYGAITPEIRDTFVLNAVHSAMSLKQTLEATSGSHGRCSHSAIRPLSHSFTQILYRDSQIKCTERCLNGSAAHGCPQGGANAGRENR